MYKRLLKWGAVGVLILTASVAGILSGHSTVQAADAQPQSFTVQVGASAPGNIDALAFAPQALQVHQGDSVTWVNNGFHNIHFASAPIPFVVAPEVDGKPLPQVNPAVAFRTLPNGSTYTGGDANSGLPMSPEDAVYSLVIDLAPGTYSFLCDIHPGMVGTLTVVDDETAIPSPQEVSLQASAEFSASLGAAYSVGLEQEAQSLQPADSGTAQVIMGSANTGRATVNQYFPFTTVIKVGESVTWTNPESSVEPHIVAWPPVRGQDVVPTMIDGQQLPVLAIGPTLMQITADGSTIKQGDAFGSGLLMPGQSYTLTFAEPGVYSYTCNIHAGMNGTIVVEAAS